MKRILSITLALLLLLIKGIVSALSEMHFAFVYGNRAYPALEFCPVAKRVEGGIG